MKHSLTLESLFSFLERQSILIDDLPRLQLKSYLSLLAAWARRMNLVSRRDLQDVPERHFLPCMWAALQMEMPPGALALDLGTGAGLPGIVVQVLFPGSRIVLLDATRKKTVFLQEVCRQLMLPSTVVCDRVESYLLDNRVLYDYVICRAVATIDTLWAWSQSLLKPGGSLLAMKGGACVKEFAWLRKENVPFQQLWPPAAWSIFSSSLKDKHIIKITR